MHRARGLCPSVTYNSVFTGHGHVLTTLTGLNFHLRGRVSGRLVAVDHSMLLRSRRGRLRGPRRVNQGWIPSSAWSSSRPPTLSWSTPDWTWWSTVLPASSCSVRWKNSRGVSKRRGSRPASVRSRRPRTNVTRGDGFQWRVQQLGESVRDQLVGQQLVEARIRRRAEDVRDLIPGQFLLGAPP